MVFGVQKVKEHRNKRLCTCVCGEGEYETSVGYGSEFCWTNGKQLPPMLDKLFRCSFDLKYSAEISTRCCFAQLPIIPSHQYDWWSNIFVVVVVVVIIHHALELSKTTLIVPNTDVRCVLYVCAQQTTTTLCECMRSVLECLVARRGENVISGSPCMQTN